MPSLPDKPRAPLAYEQLLERCLGNVEFAQRILSRFLLKFDEDFGRLEESVTAADSASVVLTAHRLKGSSANVAAGDLAQIMNDIEHLARDCDWPRIGSRLEDSRREWSRVVDHAKKLTHANSE